MATSPDPFYGCLCLETSVNRATPLPPVVSSRELPEIHFNIWERGKGAESFLDIGVMIPLNYSAELVEIFLPWELKAGEIEDLSRRISGSDGVSAIFNEAWTSSSSNGSPGSYVTRTDGTIFTIIPYSIPVIEVRSLSADTLHSIVFDVAQLRNTSLATTAMAPHQPESMYVRIRVNKVPKKFYLVGFDQGDAFGGGAFNRTEIIDFRMNVRRGVPPGFESTLHGRFIKFSKVQLFLMKSRDQDIVFEDKLFQACRSLEDENFWASYILPYKTTASATKKSLKQVKNSLGYQWKKSSNTSQSDVSEFGMLARFKSFKIKISTIVVFILLAVLVGILGNGAYDLLKPASQSPVVECSQATKQAQIPESPKPKCDVKQSYAKPTIQNSGKETLK